MEQIQRKSNLRMNRKSGGGGSLESIKELHSEKEGQLSLSVTSPVPPSLYSFQSWSLNFHTEVTYLLPKVGLCECRILEKTRAELGMYNLDFHKIHRKTKKEKLLWPGEKYTQVLCCQSKIASAICRDSGKQPFFSFFFFS